MIYPHLMETTRKTYILVHLLAELHWQPISSNRICPPPVSSNMASWESPVSSYKLAFEWEHHPMEYVQSSHV